MKTTMGKWICLSLSFAMLLVMFAGCGKEPVSSPTDVTPQSVVTPLDKESMEEILSEIYKLAYTECFNVEVIEKNRDGEWNCIVAKLK